MGDFSNSSPHFIGLIERLLVITREQHSQLVELYFITDKTVDKLVHVAARDHLERVATPSRPKA